MSAIINGKFIKGINTGAIEISSQYKQYSHEMQRLDHRKNIIQPYKQNKPNPEFIRSYPEESKKYFNQQQIEEYGNE